MKRITGISSSIPLLAALTATFLLSGCSTVTELSASGGSRADGTVTMTAEYGEFDFIKPNTQRALDSAIMRCQSWGYRSAQPFDSGLSRCSSPSGLGGCARYIYSINYQCIK